MVQGINTNVEYLGEIYHIQSEDCGPRRPMIKSLVFDKGGVVTVVETSYAELAQSPDFTEKEVARRLTIQHWKIAADLQRGALGLNGEEPGDAQVERRGGVDRRSGTKHDAEVRTRPRTAESDRRITMLSMCLAVVSVMLGFLALRGLTSLSNLDAGSTTPASVSVEQVVSQKTPVVKPARTDRRQPGDAPAAATTPRPAPERTPPRKASNPRATPVRPSAAIERVAADPRPESPASLPVVPAVQISHDSVNGNTTPVMPAAVQGATRPPMPEHSVFGDANEIRPVSVEEQPPVKLGLFPEAPPPVALGDLVELTEVDVQPRPTSREMPSYTKRAKKKRQQGTVEMHLLINERGSVADLRLKRTIPDSDLNEVAINSVRRWRFDPAREGDVAVRVWKPVSIVYSIESGQTRVDLLE